MAKFRPWSAGELDAIKKYLVDGLDNKRIAAAFPYRSYDAVIRKLNRLRSDFTETTAQEEVIKSVIDQLKEVGPINLEPFHAHDDGPHSRQLEVCIMDPHFGMQCATPESDHPWSMELASDTCMWAVESLLAKACKYTDQFDHIVFPFGNDFLHADNIYHTTTKGTNQPEMVSWHDAYKRGIELAIRMVELLKTVAPVKIYQIPGNHSTHSDYTMGLILDAYYRRDDDVEVDCSAAPYKFHRFGCNLIGYEHGNNVAGQRYAGLMANCRPDDWAETWFREWHIGDQHRKASAKPSSFEEQGVSVEYLPALTPPNQWHKTMAYNFQKRGATAYIWNETEGQEARFTVSMNPYTGAISG